MTIIWREEERSETVTIPDKAICDACGRDATGKNFNQGLVVSRFMQYMELPEEGVGSQQVGIADLCEQCACRVETFIHGMNTGYRDQKLKSALDVKGVRTPDEGGN